MAEATLQDVDAVSESEARRRFTVDLWATSLNDIEIGIMRRTQHRAKSSQFTKDMDVLGQVKVDGERTGVLAYRTSLWDDQKGAKKRLVIKLFSESMTWRGTMDMMVGRSMQLTHGSGGVPCPAFSLNVARHDHAIQLERSANKWSMFPEYYSFMILTDQGPKFYRLRQVIFGIGSDYVLLDQRNRRVGYLDGKVLDFGGLWKVKISEAHADPRLEATLQMFCAMLRFNKSARRHLDRLAQDVRRTTAPLQIDHNERDLYLNPRRAR